MFNDDTQKEEVVAEAEVEEEVEEEEEDTTDYKAEFEKTKAELEKAQRAILKNKEKSKVTVAANSELSTSDIIALSKSDVPEEDIEEVLDFAKRKQMTVKEALKDRVLQATLQVLSEERKSAEAVATPGRRGATNLTDAQVLAMGDKGEIPENLMSRYAELRLKNKSR